ncbi:arsenate reductase [Poseidonocella sedimentorum]|uniref:Arsenate reductase n=1 Tax=Poseidonocella sedimentorum TaxID=871652 RepID=A0A1I6CTE2_9RHOB|nr:arsenate reductase [Poseidonocella sedimentorum]
MSVTIWHNPRCSKSRTALKLLEDAGLEITTRRYLEAAPSLAEIRAAKAALGLTAIEMMRPGEALFSELGLSKSDDEATLLAAMAAHPRLIERPIVFRGTRAVIGRPPEAVLTLL